MGGLASTLMGSILATRPGTARAQPDGELDVPYVTTPQNVVDAMLELAEVGPSDRLLDLGSGDGRIVITAAQRHRVEAVGVDIDPEQVSFDEF